MLTTEVTRLYVDQRRSIGRRLSEKTIESLKDSAKFLPKVWPVERKYLSGALRKIRKLSPESERTHLGRWRTLGRFAAATYDVPNPFEGLQGRIVVRKERRVWSPSDYVKLYDACLNVLDTAMLDLLLGTGIRFGEIPLKQNQVGEFTIEVTGKTGARIVPITERDRSTLLETGDGDRLWISKETGQPLSIRGLKTRWRRLVDRAGITGTKRGPHTCRHSFATILLERGAELKVVAELLGHKSVTTTEIYLHTSARFRHSQLVAHDPLREVRDRARAARRADLLKFNQEATG